MRALLTFIAFLAAIPAHGQNIPDWVNTNEKCQGKVSKILLDEPPAQNITDPKCVKVTDQTKYRIRQHRSTEEIEVTGACFTAYQLMRRRHTFYKDFDICGRIETGRTKQIGPGFDAAKAAFQAGKEAVEELQAAMVADIRQASDLRRDNIKLARAAHDELGRSPAANQATAVQTQQQQERVKAQVEAASGITTVSSLEAKRRHISGVSTSIPDTPNAMESLIASYEILRFESQLRSQLPKLQQAARELGLGAARLSDLERNYERVDSPSPSGSALGSVAPYAVALAPLAMPFISSALSKNNQAGEGMGSIPPTGQDPYQLNEVKNPPAASLRNPASGSSTDGTNSSSASTLDNGKKSDSADTGDFHSPGPAFSSGPGDNQDSLPTRFSGSLGENPIFSAPSLAQGGGAAGGGSGASKGKLDDIFEKSENSSSGAMGAAAGGGSSGFGGGGSSGSDSFGDLFGNLDPLAGMKEDQAAGKDAGKAGDLFSDFKFDDKFSLSEKQGDPVPGAKDDKSLFLRVREYHKRCLMKGCVTDESGGKI